LGVDDASDPEASDEAVVRRAWSTAPGTVAAARGYYRAHLAFGGMLVSGSGGGESGDATVWTLNYFDVADTAYAQDVGFEVDVTADGDGVAVGLIATAAWAPQRPAAARIVDPTSVEVTVERTGKTTVNRTLGAAPAAQLAAVVNALPVEASFGLFTSCPIDTGTASDELRFTTAAGPVTLGAQFLGCGWVQITAEGRSTFLTGVRPPPTDTTADPALDRAILNTLGLPASYRASKY
jgi:hypothetical protein